MEAALQEGTTSSRYTILGRLTGGGMADIFLARSESIAGVVRHVVLKRVLAEHARKPAFAKMFLDEARLASQLQHPNIAQVLDVGILAGSYFFTMEYVHGKDLRAVLQRLSTQSRTLPVALVLHIAVGTLAALHHAHERMTPYGVPLGVVHRDVSPSNVMVSYEGTVKLLDFGVAKAVQNQETLAGTIKGKIGYLSPEQCRTGPIDRRSDLYSFGIVLHEMLTTRRLYRRDSDFNTMNAIVNEPTPPPSQFRDDISPALDAVLARAMQKDPQDRYATAAEMLEALEEIAAAEHLILSSTAMGRMMRDLFGERDEPWKDLSDQEATRMTITGEAPRSLRTANLSELALAEELERAPAIRARRGSEGVSELPPLVAIPSLPAAPARNVPFLISIGLGSVAVMLLIVLFIDRNRRGSVATERPAPPPAARVAIAAAPPPTAPIPTVSPLEDRTVQRTISDAFEASDWVGTVQLCVAESAPSVEQRRQCALAACNAKQRGVALDYYSALPATHRIPIERVCRDVGIIVRTPMPAARPLAPAPRKDPCEIDPLECQR